MMKTSLPYAFGMSLGGALIVLLCYLLGYHNDATRIQSAQTISMIAGTLVMIVTLVLGMRTARSESPTQSLSYGRAVGIGTLICTFSGVMSAAFTYTYGKFINPEFHQLIYEFQLAKMSEQMTASQIDQVAPMMRMTTGPGFTAGAQLLFSPVFGAIASVIVGLFMKRAPKDIPPAVPLA